MGNVRSPFKLFMLGLGYVVSLDHDRLDSVFCLIAIGASVAVPKQVQLPPEEVCMNGYWYRNQIVAPIRVS